MSSSILLTGGTGFLGSHLLKQMITEGRNIVLLKRSFSNLWRIKENLGKVKSYDLNEVPLETIFQHHDIRGIIHSATNYGRKEVMPTEVVDANLVLPLHLLQMAEKYGSQFFVNTDTLLDKRLSHYTLSKKQFLEWLKQYSEKMVCMNMAITHFYGPMDDGTKFITQMIRTLLQEPPSLALSPGHQKRDFLHVNDVVRGFSRLLEFSESAASGFYTFEVGSGASCEIKEVVESIKHLTGNRSTRLDFGALEYRPNEVMDSRANNKPLIELGWRPEIDLQEGLRQTIDFEKKEIKRTQPFQTS